MSLNEQIIECVTAAKLDDYAQRSAIGIARTWVEKQKNFEPSVHKEFRGRDELATSLVEILADAKPEEALAALAEARRVVNAPYQQQVSMGSAKMKPKDEKSKGKSDVR